MQISFVWNCDSRSITIDNEAAQQELVTIEVVEWLALSARAARA